ncbi:hypothetical protein GCM10009827_039390 [Dactylosporangium maewongense]|uniref:Uncharacterized protein n=1 Tax=Dactylosporangium maewongense TaxID=634393 RepID=A0ABN2AIG8_9ACTN
MQPEADESVPELAPQPDDEPPAPAPPSTSTGQTSSPSGPTSGAAGQISGAAGQTSGSAASAGGQTNGVPFRANTGGTPAGALATLWNDSDRHRIRGKWQELQAKFLDDPHLVASEAERLVQEAVSSLTTSLDARRSQLHQQRAARGLDTENLRASLRDYREFLDRILGL